MNDYDQTALDIARRFTDDSDPQRRASLQVAITEAMKAAAPSAPQGGGVEETPMKAGRFGGTEAAWRMDAYYYNFTATGVAAIDLILSAVACAGKAYHHTDQWNEDCDPYHDRLRGNSPVMWIENAAHDAAKAMKDLAHPRTDAAQQGAWSVPEVVERMRTDAAIYARAGHQVTANALLAFADALAAAPSAPVGVEGLVESLRFAASRWKRESDYHASGIADDYGSGQRHAFLSCATEMLAIIDQDALAQQPAADEEYAEQFRKGWQAGYAAAQQPAAVDGAALREVARQMRTRYAPAIGHSTGASGDVIANCAHDVAHTLSRWADQIDSAITGQQQENGNG